MRINSTRKRRRRVRISLWAAGVVALCAVVPDAPASDLVHFMPSVWAAAAALSLTLISAVGAQK
ncbi:MAG TPA: hypothetical protein VGO37_02325 [Steroidobacteraceae bacterium]|jgi:hypothetical protein|nr:hypothetical protein [Steroidobacteraceae bacterium]